MVTCKLHVFAFALAVVFQAATALAEDDVPRPLDRRTAVRLAAERSHVAAAARAAARASRQMADAEDRLPDPELMAEAWQVPIARPLAYGDANMLAVWVRQTIPPPGSRGSRMASYEAEARMLEAGGKDRTRMVEREAAHAFVDVQTAVARHASHFSHREVADRVVLLAETRLASGAGRLGDVAQTQVERARLDADVAFELALVDKARSRLNALLRRPIDAPLETVPLGSPETSGIDTSAALAIAQANRPELVQLRARRTVDEESARAASREARLPTFTVGVGWFAPTSLMPIHGYGVTLGATLPWIWGSSSARARAFDARAEGAGLDEREMRNQVLVEVTSALADVRAAERRVSVLRSRAKPAADRGLEVALSAYESGQGDASAVVRAEKDAVEIDVAIIDAEAQLAHALAEADWAAGTQLPRAPLGGAR